jgi:hypothetical protein
MVNLLVSNLSTTPEMYLYSEYSIQEGYYEVYENIDFTSVDAFNKADSIFASFTVIYETNVVPATKKYFTKKYDGTLYGGELTLYSYKTIGGKTSAEYRGNLYRLE